MKNRRNLIAPSVLSLLLIASLIWGYNQNQSRNQLQVYLDNHHQRLFFDIKKHVENMQVSISKALVATSRERCIANFAQLVSEANFAQDKLNQLPTSHADNHRISKFLTQAADYANYLIQRRIDGEDLTQEEREALTTLQENSGTFNAELANLHQSLMENNFLMGMNAMAYQDLENADQNVLNTSLISLDQQIGKTPELIYDGPFSDQILNKRAVGLQGQNVDLNRAQEAAMEFFGRDRVAGVEPFEEGENANEVRIPSYTFNIATNNQPQGMSAYMGVAKQGATVLWMENPRVVGNKALSVEQGQQAALEFLRSKGFENMEPNYSLQYDGIVLYNFAHTQNNVTIYPDLVKVKVALDNGEVVGFDASTYYLNHKQRNFRTPQLSVEEARQKIRTNFDVESVRLALIPKGVDEILCYEFKGTYEGADFLVYVNTNTGIEEQILQLIQDENGTLTF